jgi:diguanylate cyclase (GGDEF)-like protein
MDIGFEVWISAGCIFVIMLSAIWFFKDKPGARPARLAFRIFSLALLALFIATVSADFYGVASIGLIANLSFIIAGASLLLGLLWRSQSVIPDYVVYLWALAFAMDNLLFKNDSLAPSYLLETMGALLAAYALFKRPNGNAGDKGIVLVLLVWVGVFVFEFSGAINVGSGDHKELALDNSLALVLAPTYMIGLTIFLISSYMLDAQHDFNLLAVTDSKTGLYKRYHFLEEAQALLTSASRAKYPMSILMCDIDSFKQVNHKYGHDSGDSVLKAFSECLASMVGTGDILARYEEGRFVMLLPKTNGEAAMLVAEHMREETEVIRVKANKGNSVRFTASFGVCQITDFDDIQTGVSEVNTAMQQAKSDGRNNVSLYKHCMPC